MEIKEIPLSGLSSVPSDYECQDGQLQVCHNMAAGKGIAKPVAVSGVPTLGTDGELVIVHKTSLKNVYISVNGDKHLQWQNGNSWTVFSDLSDKEFVVGRDSVTHVGNILIVSYAAGGMHYLLFIDNVYKYLGDKLPDIEIEFSLQPTSTVIDNDDKTENKENRHITTLDSEGTAHRMRTRLALNNWSSSAFVNPQSWEDNKSTIDNGIFGAFNYIYNKTAEKGQFVHPFLVRYAYRMYDGTYAMQSAPILMSPSDMAKINISILLAYYEDGNNPCDLIEKYGQQGMGVSITSKLYKQNPYAFLNYTPRTLNYRVKDASVLNGWSDIIDGIDIFITPQISEYTATGKIDISPSDAGNSGGSNAYHDITDIKYKFYINSTTATNRIYEISQIDNTDVSDKYLCVAQVIMPKREGAIKDWIEEAAQNFRLAKSLTSSEITEAQNTWKVIERNNVNLNTFERLADGYAPRRIYRPNLMHVYNNRLNLANCQITERAEYPSSFVGARLTTSNNYPNKKAIVYLQNNGIWYKSKASYAGSYNSGFFFYPDPNAKWLYIEGEGYYKLSRHNYLFGAYLWSGNLLSRDTTLAKTKPSELPDVTDESVNYIPQHNYIYTTAVDNPFVVDVQGVNTVGNGDIISIQNATQAMSEGTAFGAQPLNVFATDGIYTLQINAVGLYDRAAPLSRETIKSASDVLAIDNSIIFLTERGLMELNGSQTRLLSPVLSERYGNIVWGTTTTLPHFDDINTAGDYNSEWTDSYYFLQYIKDAKLAFDYENYRIYVYKPACAHAYIYDINTQQWSTCDNNIKSSIAGYPATLLTYYNGQSRYIAEFSNESTALIGDGKVMYVTRPMKLDGADVLKTVRDIIQRGSYHNNNSLKLALWGSRDLTHWQYISGVNGNRIARIMGTPYKYFVAAGWAKLDIKGDAISRLTVMEEDKYTNRLR